MNKEINRAAGLRVACLVPFLFVTMPFAAAAAAPAVPLVTENFVNKSGVLGMAWNPVAGAASMRLQVAGVPDGCPLATTKPATCFINQAVPLNGPLNPIANTGVGVSGFNGGNIYARLVAVDSTGKQMTGSAWMKVPRYLGLTSGGKAWPIASVEPGRSVAVAASLTNSTTMIEFWAFDINGNLPNKSHVGTSFVNTPMPVGIQSWVLKSKSGGLVIDQGSVQVQELPVLKYTVPPISGSGTNCQPQCVTFVKVNSGLSASYGDAFAYETNIIPGFSAIQYNGSTVVKPKPGDILVFRKNSVSAVGHVALVESVNLAAGTITRVATNENGRCAFSRVTGALQRSSTGVYSVVWTDSAKSWNFAGWRPKN